MSSYLYKLKLKLDEAGQTAYYIGKTEDLGVRLKNHLSYNNKSTDLIRKHAKIIEITEIIKIDFDPVINDPKILDSITSRLENYYADKNIKEMRQVDPKVQIRGGCYLENWNNLPKLRDKIDSGSYLVDYIGYNGRITMKYYQIKKAIAPKDKGTVIQNVIQNLPQLSPDTEGVLPKE